MKQTFTQKVDAAGKAAANHDNIHDCNHDCTREMVFENPEFGIIRTMTDENGEPLFCGKDVCEALGYKLPHTAVRQHVNRHDVVKHIIGLTIGKKRDGSSIVQYRQVLFVTESGFYALVLGSKLDTAQRFKQWVTSVVLPAIRKHGGYIATREGDTAEDIRRRAEDVLRATLQEKDSFIALQKKLISEQNLALERKDRQIAEQDVEIDRLLPKALYADTVLDSISCYTTTQVAKELGLTAQELNRQLCALRIQYYQSGQYMLYADYAHRGLARSRTHFDLVVGTDTVRTRTYLVWTEKGRRFIHEKVKSEE